MFKSNFVKRVREKKIVKSEREKIDMREKNIKKKPRKTILSSQVPSF